MDQKIARIIDGYRDTFTETLRRWVRTPSVKGSSEAGAPFGRDIRNMLDTAMADAREMGFEVRDFDGYACDVTLGSAEGKIAVLGHLDVVPVGDGWTKPPFDALIENTEEKETVILEFFTDEAMLDQTRVPDLVYCSYNKKTEAFVFFTGPGK